MRETNDRESIREMHKTNSICNLKFLLNTGDEIFPFCHTTNFPLPDDL